MKIRRSLFFFALALGYLVTATPPAEAWVGPRDHASNAVYAPQRRHSEQFVKGPDGYLHYHYYYANKWRVDKNTFRRGGKVDGPIAVVYSKRRRHAEAIFRGADGYLRYFYIQRGWQMKVMRFAGKITGDLATVYEPQRNAVGIFARDASGYLRYLYYHARKWRVDKNSFRGAGKVSGAISAVYSPQNRHSEVFFRGANGYLHRYYASHKHGWRHDHKAFRKGGRVAGNISAVYASHRKHSEVFYRGSDGYLRYFFWHGNRWTLDKNTFRRRGHKVAGAIAAVYAQQRRHSEVFYRDIKGHVRYFYLYRGWQMDTRSFRKGGRVKGPIAAVYSPQRRHAEFYYTSADGKRRFFYNKRGWKLHTWPAAGAPKAGKKGKTAGGPVPFEVRFPVNKVIAIMYKRLPILKKMIKFKNPKLTVTGGDGEKGTFEKATLTGQVDVYPPKIESPLHTIRPRIKKLSMEVEVSFSGAFEEFELKATSRFAWSKPFGIQFLSFRKVGFEVKYNRSDKEFEIALLGTAKIGRVSFPGRMMLQIGGSDDDDKKDGKPQKSELRKRRDKRIMDRRRKKGVKRRRKKKKKAKKKSTNLEITDISLEITKPIDVGALPGMSKIPLIRKLRFSNLKLAMSEISGTVEWRGKFKASAAVVYRGAEKMIVTRVSGMSLGGLVPRLPPMLAKMKFPQLMVVISAKDLHDKTIDDLAPKAGELFAGVVEDDDDLPIQSGVNVFGLFSPKMFPKRSPLRKALENELGIKDSLVIGGALGGFEKKPTKISFFASLPGFKLPSRVPIRGRLRPNPLRKYVSLARSKLFIRANVATQLLQVGISGGINLKIPRVNNVKKLDPISLIGELYIQVDGPKYGIRVAGRMSGKWTEPLGLGHFAIKNPAFVVGYGNGNNVTFGIGGTTLFEMAPRKWEEYSGDFLISVIISKVPIVNKLGVRLRAARLSAVTGVQLADRLFKGVLLGPMAQVIVKQLPRKQRAIAKKIGQQLRRQSMLKAMKLDRLPLPIVELRDVDIYFATPNATIPGRENTMTGMGVGIAGKARVRFMGKTYKIGALKHFLTVADGYILKGHLEPRKLGHKPFQFDLKAAKVDIKANFSELPHFKVKGDITDPIGSKGKIDIELSARRAKFLAHLDIKRILKLHIKANTVGSSLFTAKDFQFEAYTKDTLKRFMLRGLLPKLKLEPALKNEIRRTINGAYKLIPIHLQEVRVKGSLVKFVMGKQPATIYVKHAIHGKQVRPIHMKIKPVWKARDKREILTSLFPIQDLSTKMILSYINNSPLGPGKPFRRQLLVNKATGKCLQFGGRKSPLTVKPCNGSARQRWDFNQRGAWSLRSGGSCADGDAPLGFLEGGKKVQAWSCHAGTNQKWKVRDGQIQSVTGLYCWDVTAGRVRIAKCDRRRASQGWSVKSKATGIKVIKKKLRPSRRHKICLQTTTTKKFVRVNVTGLAVQATASGCLAWESMVVNLGKTDFLRSWQTVSIRSHKGYWSAQNNGGLQANRGKVSAWEKFRFYKIGARPGTPIKDGDTVAIYSPSHKRWVKFHKGGPQYIRADALHPKTYQQFTITFQQ